MNRFVLALVLCAAAACAVPALAQDAPQVYAGPTAAPNQFTDPAMTFTVGPGYVKAPIPPHDPTQFEEPTLVAAFAGNTKATAGRAITIQMENFDGNLAGFETVTENELRNQMDGVFVKKHELTTLSNGMPAYWQDITVGSGFNEEKRYEYVWVDGVRGIVLAVSARYGTITEDEAKKALANASSVAYPNGRP